jgi:hypothetical protein
MGWASAGHIFEAVADATIDAHLDERQQKEVLAPLINELLVGDWDTWDESIDEYRNQPGILAAFNEFSITLRGRFNE